MNDCVCVEFTKTFKGLNLKLKESDERGYDYTMLLLYVHECNRGFKVKRVNKTNKSGTSVVYEAIKDEYDMKNYKAYVEALVANFNDKWNEELELS